MRSKVVIVPRAERDLDSIYRFLAERSPQGLRAWHDRWLDVEDFLATSAETAPCAPENDDHVVTIQHHLFRTSRGRRYRVIFTRRQSEVFVLSVRGPGRQLATKEELRIPPQIE